MFPERIILSRKGFDKGTGKLPSPILPDGRMLSLPIPQYPNGIQAHGKPTTVTTRYCDLHGDGAAFGDHLRQQTARRRIPITGETIVHLDPDIRPDLRPCNFFSVRGWRRRAIFGTSASGKTTCSSSTVISNLVPQVLSPNCAGNKLLDKASQKGSYTSYGDGCR
jgi:hypothetical protein